MYLRLYRNQCKCPAKIEVRNTASVCVVCVCVRVCVLSRVAWRPAGVAVVMRLTELPKYRLQ